MEFTGSVKAILPIVTGVSKRTGNPWASMDFVLETQEQYPKCCCFKIFGQDRINSYNLQMGEIITACFDINAHEHNGRWYNEVNCFAIKRNGEIVQVQQTQPQRQPQASQYPPTANVANRQMPPQGYQQQYTPSTADQDLPF